MHSNCKTTIFEPSFVKKMRSQTLSICLCATLTGGCAVAYILRKIVGGVGIMVY